MSALLTAAQRVQLLANGRRSATDPHHSAVPVVKLFTPDAACTWLLCELDPDEPDVAFGLADLGMGFPELGCVRLSELEQARGKLGLRIERDRWFTGTAPISVYAEATRKVGHIVETMEGAP